jgi:hypothetical protein
MSSQDATGSFMLLSNVIKYFEDNNHDSDNLLDSVVMIDERAYLPTKIVSNRMTNMDWRTMQSEVTTAMFGLEPIIFI